MMEKTVDSSNGKSEPVTTTAAAAQDTKTMDDDKSAPPLPQKVEATLEDKEVAAPDNGAAKAGGQLEVDETAEAPWDETSQYVTGVKLAMVVACMCLSCFLMLIDTMVVSTVSSLSSESFRSSHDLVPYQQGLPKPSTAL